MNAPLPAAVDWPLATHQVLARHGVGLVGYVPDAGHKRLIELCQADARMRTVVMTTEEEGVGLAAGAWLGGVKCALLMQSSGVGNIINALGMTRECRFPLLLLATMRGENGEFNPWQVPMGQATPGVLRAMGVVVHQAESADAVPGQVDASARIAFGSYCAAAVLISQVVIGIKSFQEQSGR
ncbi:MAG TPA: thiamine pyrophosphate-binding protein [Burkholderiales bacterium]|nr:thiamine pyrophosphate-binding protein [Burkholderiales bacterium]